MQTELLDADVRAFLKALASQTRQEIMLLFQGDIELTVSQIANRLDLAQSATSAHLATLRDAGILVARREWKTVHYQANPNGIMRGIDGLRDYLMACCPPTEERECACSSDSDLKVRPDLKRLTNPTSPLCETLIRYLSK